MDRKERNDHLNPAERRTYVDELLRSPIGVLVIARSIVEVAGSPPNMPFADHLGAVYSAQEVARCLQELANREGGEGQAPGTAPTGRVSQCSCDVVQCLIER